MPRNLQIAKAFKKARVHIENDDHQFICHTLYCPEYKSSRKSSLDKAKEIIRQRMGHNGTLNDWVWVNIFNTAPETYPSDEDMKAYRLRWLDALIKEFS